MGANNNSTDPDVRQVMFWDVRLDKLLKKGNKRVDETDVVWKPMHVVHVLSVAGEQPGSLRTCRSHLYSSFWE